IIMSPPLSNVYASFIPGSMKEKAFVRSKSLPREKQAGATQQRSDAARCLSQENDSKRTKKRFFSIKRKNTTLSSV
ncbi:MAG: hypothetical protein WAL00_06080, partial [Exiguobacterium undae]